MFFLQKTKLHIEIIRSLKALLKIIAMPYNNNNNNNNTGKTFIPTPNRYRIVLMAQVSAKKII